jgi:transcriptional antiterminator RfaH
MNQQINFRHVTEHWYVVHCQPFKESQVASTLEQQLGLTCYLPEVRQHFRGKKQRAPLFPRYLFVRADLQVIPLSHINATPGVVRLVSFSDTPQPVPYGVIEALHKRVEYLDADGGLPMHTFRHGELVRLIKGPLSGIEAIFQGPLKPSERVAILIEFLGSLRAIDVDIGMLEPVRHPTPSAMRRRSRGGGRIIRNCE